MLKAALSGSYVNFGVFRLYGDDALENALQTFIKLLLSIPHSDLLVSPKPHRQLHAQIVLILSSACDCDVMFLLRNYNLTPLIPTLRRKRKADL